MISSKFEVDDEIEKKKQPTLLMVKVMVVVFVLLIILVGVLSGVLSARQAKKEVEEKYEREKLEGKNKFLMHKSY